MPPTGLIKLCPKIAPSHAVSNVDSCTIFATQSHNVAAYLFRKKKHFGIK